MRALISVSDKTGIVEMAHEMAGLGFEIISTGGTAQALRQAEIPCTEVSELTDFPEILGGRVKTLHPHIFGGILYERENPKHLSDVKTHEIPAIDWVVVNLYPFEKINLENKIPKEERIEFIDIGGVSLLRAAAKNFQSVVVLSQAQDYPKVLKEFKEKKMISLQTKKELAAKAFAHTAHYDSVIAKYFREEVIEDIASLKNGVKIPSTIGSADPIFPEEFTVAMRKVSALRYGENPQQKASLYKESGLRDWGIVNAEKLQGKELSFNNYLDLDSAWQIVNSLGRTGVACVIVKHSNPSGASIAKDALEAFQQAFNTDSLSAFGGVIGFSGPVNAETAREITKTFFECVIAPDYAPESLEIFKGKANLRILRQTYSLSLPYECDIKKISGGYLVQDTDRDSLESASTLGKPVTKRAPSAEELYALEFAWKICKFVKSNAIVLAQGQVTRGVGAGQMSRIDSFRIAVQKMNDSKRCSPPLRLPLVMASDAFFPFRDTVDEAAKIGVTAIVQPGGSLRDQESVDAANEHNISMILTGIRHFKH